ncbi:MAG: ABC transporter ATP-binding protein [Bacteriovoracaceae bacterium]|nr:ABC transporter ATP-binding protein [Bacteriovoracaceae bacterium]
MSFLKIESLEFKYPKGPTILSIPHLSLEEGQGLFLYGPSGHGKSTLLNLIAGVLAVTSGEISIGETKLHQLSAGKKDKWRGDNLGYVFQQFNLIPYLSIFENIMLPCQFSKERKLKTSDKEIHELIERMNLSSFIHRPVKDLSIGQQQRVALCRALVGKPKLLLADEPTSALDEKNTTELMNLLKEERAKNQLTTIFVSHDLRLKPYFDIHHSLVDLNQSKLSDSKMEAQNV